MFDHVVVRAHLEGQRCGSTPRAIRKPDRWPTARRCPSASACRSARAATAGRNPATDAAAPVIDVGPAHRHRVHDARVSRRFHRRQRLPQREGRRRPRRLRRGDEARRTRYLSYMRRYYAGLRSARHAVAARARRRRGRRAHHRTLLAALASVGGIGLQHRAVPVAGLAAELDLESAPCRSRSTARASGARSSARNWTAAGKSRRAKTPSANAYFAFHRTVRVIGDALEIIGEWKRLASEVPAADYARVRDDMDASGA